MEEENVKVTEVTISNIIEEVKTLDENNDIFDTYSKAKSICEFLELDANKKILEKNNLIAIYGSWGTGKSCLMKTIENNLDSGKFETLWFDTWKYEKDENLPYSLMKFVGKERFLESLTQKAASAGCFLYGLFSSIANGIEVEAGISKLINVTLKPGETVKSLKEYAQKIDKQVEDEMCLWEKVQWFEEEFKKAKVTKDSNKRLVVFLDDLDRCESENIITLMSSIKLLLSANPNIIFILGIDKSAVTLALKNKYGNEGNKADEYLEKIFPITFEITTKLKTENFSKYISNITSLTIEDSQFVVDFFYKINFTNSRHIKKVLRKYYFIKEYLISNGYDLANKFNVVFVLYNIILNVFYNDEYQYFIQEDQDSKYKEIVFVSFSSTNVRREENFERNQTRFICIKGATLQDYKLGIYPFLAQFSSYKIKNKYLMAKTQTANSAYIEYYRWKAIFEEGICNRYLDYIIKTEECFNYYFEDNSGEKLYRKVFFDKFIQDLSKIM